MQITIIINMDTIVNNHLDHLNNQFLIIQFHPIKRKVEK
jgi:hypothetical protein